MTTTILPPYNEKEERSQLIFLTKKMKLSSTHSTPNELIEVPNQVQSSQDVYERLQFIFPTLSKEVTNIQILNIFRKFQKTLDNPTPP